MVNCCIKLEGKRMNKGLRIKFKVEESLKGSYIMNVRYIMLFDDIESY